MTHSFKDVQDSTAEYYVVDWQFRTPDGYKNSDIGIIPADWRVDSLSAVIGDLKAGVSVNSISGDIGFLSAESPAVLKTSCVQAGQFFPREAKLIASMDVGRATITPVANSILISRMNTIGLVGESGYVAQDYPALYVPDRLWMTQFKSDARLCVRWLSYVLSSDAYRTYLKSIATGTSGSMKNIAKRGVLDLRVAFPCYSEQRAISEALADVDSLLESLDRLIAKKRAVKQAAMQQLLTGKTRLPGFDGEWFTKRMGDIASIRMGRTPSRNYARFWGQVFVWLSIADLKGKVINSSKEQVTDAAAATMKIVPKGTLLMSFKLSIGRLAFAGCDLFTNEAICSFHDLKADAGYIYYALQRTDFSLYGKQAVKGYTLNSESLKNVEVALPPKDEQIAIATALQDMDAEIERLVERRDKTEELKQGMMQQLLTGRIRLIKPDVSEAS